jgi:hypothetical protein
MVIVLALAAWVGGLITAIALWPFGWLVALVGAPFGGSALALIVAVLVALRGSYAEKARSNQRLSTSGYR